MSLTEAAIREQLKKVIDPELFVNIEDLGLVYLVNIGEPDDQQKQAVNIDMTLTSPMCPAGPQLVAESRQFVSELEGVGEVEVRVVMEPAWSPERMTDDARDQLGIF